MEEKGKSKIDVFLEGKFFWVVVILLVAVTAFSLGRISAIQDRREPVKVIDNGQQASVINSQQEEAKVPTSEGGIVVGSKNGTKYHYPWCAGAKQISEKNKITFNSIEEARAAGYTPASNCKGLK